MDDWGRLEESMGKVWEIARGFGLDPYPTHFELVPASIMYEFGSYGLPGRFSHWTHGKAYHQMKTMYDYGLSKIYELVINSNPCYAFLLEGNSYLQNVLVVAHVLAHCDFFKNNAYFGPTNRSMVGTVSIHADRIRKYVFDHGSEEVERILDAVLSIDHHIDPHVFSKAKTPEQLEKERKRPIYRETPYDDLFALDPDGRPKEEKPVRKKFPEEPQRDVLRFIMEHSPVLEDWQRDVMAMIRDEAYYFLPQMQTKIMNEGWASYWHVRILREMGLTDEECLEFAKLHSGVLAPSNRSINPYFVGMKIFEDIEKRWDEPTDEEREKFGRRGGEGRAKIFEVRSLENDASFLRGYLTKKLVEDLDLYLYQLEGNEWRISEKGWEKVRDSLVALVINGGQPVIEVDNGDYRKNGELLLVHRHEGVDLDRAYAEKTLAHLERLWGRPVQVRTIVNGERIEISFDGEKITSKKV